MAHLVATVISKISSEEELRTLQQLTTLLSSHVNDGASSTTLSELGEELNLDEEACNPFPRSTPDSVCSRQEDLNSFTCYLFDRRFGWSETDTQDGRRVRRLSSTGVTMSAGSGKQKAMLNTLLDSFLKWYMCQELSSSVLLALKYTIKQSANSPVVRNRAVIHMMDWCKNNADQLCDNSFYHTIQELVMMSVTDVWSAIRNACATRLSPVAASLNIEQVHSLYNSLVKVCCGDSSWQAKEGAIMGINAVLQRFLNKPSNKSPMSSPRTLDTDVQERRIPESISKDIHSVVFGLLSHSQLTIREHAAKTLATYITCSCIADALATLREVIVILSRGSESHCSNDSQVPSHQFLGDYEAEGFLGVCVFLVKVLPLSYLLPGWPEYISTFLLYISHPASTVRQAASSVFKYLVVKSSSSVVVLKLILQALAMGWNPDTDSMTKESSSDSVGQPLPSVCDYTGTNLCDTWEGREGRLFAYELIFKFLIKNHWLYTFGPAGSGFQIETNASKDVANAASNKINADTHNDLAQSNSFQNPLHHVESEKTLAMEVIVTLTPILVLSGPDWIKQCVMNNNSGRIRHFLTLVRFLTQANIYEDQNDTGRLKKQFDRVTSIDQEKFRTGGPRKGRMGHKEGSASGLPENICSLLTEAQLVDSISVDGSEMDTSRLKQEHQLDKLRQIVSNNRNCVVPCKCGWMDKEYLQDMARILKVILYQTSESLGHSQWELRRIANQVLPCLAEVIRWYDINLLVSVWNSYLNVAMPTCLMTFTSVSLLKESVIHSVRLMQLLNKPPQTWQDQDRCKDCLSVITSTIQRKVPAYLPHLQHLLHRLSYDRLSVLAADVILMAYEHLDVTTDQRMCHYMTVLQFWKSVFYFAHPQTRISVEFLQTSHRVVFVSPFEGYLSCCLVKPENKTQCAKQIEKQFVMDVCHRLPAYLSGLSVHDAMSVAPLLAHYVGMFVEDSYISKAVLESLHGSVSGIVALVTEETDREAKYLCVRFIQITLKELSAVIAMKSVDLPQIQRILGVYEELCQPISLQRHLRVLLTGIAARVNEAVEFTVDNSPRPGYDGDDLCMLSNDIPRSVSPELEEDSDSEEVIVGTPSSNRFIESLTLNTSNNSGSLTGRLSALSVHSNDGCSPGNLTPRDTGPAGSDSEEESSDWDSWDEEDESQSAFREVFSEFLEKLQKPNNSEFMAEVRKLRDQEKSVYGFATSVDPDLMPQNAASDQGPHCSLLISIFVLCCFR